MLAVTAEPGSFRDPSGRIYRVGDRIFRTVEQRAVEDFRFVESTGLLDMLAERRLAIPVSRVENAALGTIGQAAALVLEAPKIPFISYPYEWCFSALKSAALLHLDVQLLALEKGVALSDSSAYNVQFQGAEPVFIDHLSFRRYRPGEIWAGHRQFCEQFLNPLILRARLGIPFNAWYRGAQEGITAAELRPLLKPRHKLSRTIFTHVVLQAMLQGASRSQAIRLGKENGRVEGLPQESLRRMLAGLRRWIADLKAADTGETVWQRYARENSYTAEESERKRQFVRSFAERVQPALLWDLGCNAGDYAKAALEGGAGYVVGFDFDTGALEAAYARARAERLAFLPLYMDATNPSPDQGWRQAERPGLQRRASADAVVALAFIHHLAIAKNIPLDQLVEWLTGLAPNGVIEFVPKRDPMVQRLLQNREDIFPNYDEENFLTLLSGRARIIETTTVSATGRKLVWFSRL